MVHILRYLNQMFMMLPYNDNTKECTKGGISFDLYVIVLSLESPALSLRYGSSVLKLERYNLERIMSHALLNYQLHPGTPYRAKLNRPSLWDYNYDYRRTRCRYGDVLVTAWCMQCNTPSSKTWLVYAMMILECILVIDIPSISYEIFYISIPRHDWCEVNIY